MKKTILTLLVIIGIVFLIPSSVFAQMMGNGSSVTQGLYGSPAVTPTQQDLQDIQTGQDLYTKFQNKQLSCTTLQDADFEKIGEFIMNQQFGNANTHIQMNERIKSMVGNKGEERMHIAIARSATGCNNVSLKGGAFPMMGWSGYGAYNMMNGNYGWGFATIHFIIAAVILVDLILLGIFLWKKISK